MVNGIFIRNYALYMSGGQNYLLLAMDMAKAGGCEGLYFHAV